MSVRLGMIYAMFLGNDLRAANVLTYRCIEDLL
jgi:hypothetical protein